jgi:hypothetical protein
MPQAMEEIRKYASTVEVLSLLDLPSVRKTHDSERAYGVTVLA